MGDESVMPIRKRDTAGLTREASLTTQTIRTADVRAMRRYVRQGAVVVAEYRWEGCGIRDLEARGREWVLRGPPTTFQAARKELNRIRQPKSDRPGGVRSAHADAPPDGRRVEAEYAVSSAGSGDVWRAIDGDGDMLDLLLWIASVCRDTGPVALTLEARADDTMDTTLVVTVNAADGARADLASIIACALEGDRRCRGRGGRARRVEVIAGAAPAPQASALAGKRCTP